MAIPSRGILDFPLKVLQSFTRCWLRTVGGGSQVPENPLGTLPRFLSVEKFIKVANINMINIRTTSSGNVNLPDKLALLCCLQGILGAAPLCEIRKLEQASVK